MAAVTVCSDFGAQENKACRLFEIFLLCTIHETLEMWSMKVLMRMQGM